MIWWIPPETSYVLRMMSRAWSIVVVTVSLVFALRKIFVTNDCVYSFQ